MIRCSYPVMQNPWNVAAGQTIRHQVNAMDLNSIGYANGTVNGLAWAVGNYGAGSSLVNTSPGIYSDGTNINAGLPAAGVLSIKYNAVEQFNLQANNWRIGPNDTAQSYISGVSGSLVANMATGFYAQFKVAGVEHLRIGLGGIIRFPTADTVTSTATQIILTSGGLAYNTLTGTTHSFQVQGTESVSILAGGIVRGGATTVGLNLYPNTSGAGNNLAGARLAFALILACTAYIRSSRIKRIPSRISSRESVPSLARWR